MFSTAIAIALWASVQTLAPTATAPVEPVIERYADGSVFAGAISPNEADGSVGVTFRADGSVVLD